ncbi:hypothetical protein Tco_1509983 [Tanacetum coccineum]
MNESSHKSEPHFTKPESSFAFGSNDEIADEKNDYDDGVDVNPQPMHSAIALAIHNEFPLAFHVVCCRHLMMNLSLKKGLFWKICKEYTPEEFASNMNILQAVEPDAYHKLCEASPQRWSIAHCLLVRYNYMTSNSVESINACSVINRKLLVLKLVETYRAMVQDWYYKRQELTANMTYEITDWVANKVTKKG